MATVKEPIFIYRKGSKNPCAKTVTINCLGDSITNGVGSNTDPEDRLNKKGSFQPYYSHWEKDYQLTARNYGQNGSFVAAYDIRKGPQPNDSRPFVRRYAEMDSDADIVTILGGVNDCQAGYGVPEEFGLLSDPSVKNINTFCGALRTMLEGLLKKYPHALIVYLTPLKYGDKKAFPDVPWENADTLPQYVRAIQTICAQSRVPVIDLYTPEQLHFCTGEGDASVCGDRLHFGWKAHAALGEYIFRQMEAMRLIRIIDKI